VPGDMIQIRRIPIETQSLHKAPNITFCNL
jgi:hypothetical protein